MGKGDELQIKLAELLREAMSSAVIRDPGGSHDTISFESYRQIWYEHRNHYRPQLYNYLLGRYPILEDGPLHQELLSVLSESLHGLITDGGVYVASTGAGSGQLARIELPTILRKLLLLSIVFTADEAASSFVRVLEGQICTFQVLYLLDGASMSQEIEVTDGVRFVPLPHEVWNLPGSMPSMSSYQHFAKRAIGKVLLEVDHEMSFRFVKSSNHRLDSEDVHDSLVHNQTLDRSFLWEYVEMLSLVSRSLVEIKASWHHTPDNEFVSHLDTFSMLSFGGGADSQPNPNPIEVNPSQVNRALELYRKRMELKDGDRDRLRIPLQRWLRSIGEDNLVDRAIDLGIALESLYVEDGGPEITYRLGIRAASHLRQNLDDRKGVKDWIGGAYRLRSSAVHSGRPPKGRLRVSGRSIPHLEILNEATELCAEGIERVIVDGYPVWDDLVLGRR